MKMVNSILFLAIICALTFANQGYANPAAENARAGDKQAKKAILVVSFGTSVAGAEKGITNLVDAAKKAFPDYDVRLAYTSNIIRRKIAKERKLIIPAPPEALAELNDKGYTHVYVMPTHIIPGKEYDDVKSVVSAAAATEGKYAFSEIRLGEPFMATIPRCELMADVMIKRFSKELADEKTAIVLMGHGSHEHFSHALYAQLQMFLDRKAPSRFFIGTVEAAPVIEDIVRELKKTGNSKVVLSPFMVVAGDHAINDMADPDDSESWMSVLKAAGYRDISVRQEGLGEDSLIAGLFVRNLKKLAD